MGRQGELFAATALGDGPAAPTPAPPLLRQQLLTWQARVTGHQGPLFAGDDPGTQQGLLFGAIPSGGAAPPGDPGSLAAGLDPLSLQARSLSFWRWPSPPRQGAALYLVTDRPAEPSPPLLLYVGETARADRRWKGDHDCKSYLAAYSEALARAGLAARLAIRFWYDVPGGTRERRALEQALIRLWLPPFNKETRDRWATPFTAEPS
jgi:hypothetical protein